MRDLEQRIRQRLEESLNVHVQLAEQADLIASAARALVSAYQAGRKALFFGNGGSAADAQHLAAELVGRFRLDRRPLPAVALAANVSSLTAIANDMGFDFVFARQVEGLGQPGDVAVGISTSGRSRNVLEALRVARQIGMTTILLTGDGGREVASQVDYCVWIPSSETSRIQEGHILIGHILCELVEHALFGRLSVRTVFVDLDALIAREILSGDHVFARLNFQLVPGVQKALRDLKVAGSRVVVVASWGSIPEANLVEVQERILGGLADAGAPVDAVYACVHVQGTCDCRKPAPGLLVRARHDFPDIDFTQAAVVGGSVADIELGRKAGCFTILVGEDGRRTEVLREALRKGLRVDRVARSLEEVVEQYLLPGEVR